MNETSHRHQIMKDASFWTSLAFVACGWLRESENASLHCFWIDGFLPEHVLDTKHGVDIKRHTLLVLLSA